MTDAAMPIPAPAAREMKEEAENRLDKVNPHLLRVTTEVQKMMMFHQYAAPVLAALAGKGLEPGHAAVQAAQYADAMMALVRVRDASCHAQAAEHFETMPQAVPPTQEETRAAVAAAVAPPIPTIRTCNRHSNCAESEAEYKKKHGRNPGINFHCHDESCEDCFGK